MNKKNITSSVFVALLLTALWFYIYQDLFDNQDNQAERTGDELVATSTSPIDSVSLNSGEDDEYVLKEISTDTQTLRQQEIIKPIPDLDRKIEFLDDFSEEARQIMIDEMGTISQELKNDPTVFSNWLYLGLDRKSIGDYEGARQAWEYAKLLNPDNFVVRGNLGDLYAYYIRDNIKAEENYLKAVEIAPDQIYLYFKTAEFYRDFLNDNQKAINIVQTGLIQNPNSSELQSLIESLK